MKKSKKLLSILLAVVIALSSLSAGISVFAEKDPYEELIEALSSNNVKNAVWGEPVVNGEKYFTIVADPSGDIEKAVIAFQKVAKLEMQKGHTGDAQKQDINRTARGVVNSILDILQSEPYNLSGDELVNATNTFIAFIGGMKDENYNSSSKDYPAEPGERKYGIRITMDIKSLLMTMNADISKLPNEVVIAHDYYFEHGAGKYSTGSWIFKKYHTYNFLNEDGMKISDVLGAGEEIAALKMFGSHFSKEQLNVNLERLSPAELDSLEKKNQKIVDSLGALWGQEELIDYFFGSKDAIEDFIVNVSAERDKKIAVDVIEKFNELMKNVPETMEYDDLVVLLNETKDLKTELDTCSKEAQKTACDQIGITIDDINSFIIRVNEEKEVIELQGFKDIVDNVIDGFVIKGNEKQNIIDALKVVMEQLSMITSRTFPAINRVFPDGLGYITDFLTEAKLEIDFIDLNEAALVDYFVYFNSDLLSADLTEIATDELIDERLKKGKEKLNAINEFDKVTVERVFGDKYTEITEYIESIYKELTARITEQGNEIFGCYNRYNKVTLLNHNDVEAAIGSLESQIYPVVEDRLPESFRNEYAKVAAMAEELAEYNRTFGVNAYLKTEMEYPERGPMDNDAARTPEDIYIVTNEKLNTSVEQIDKIINDEKFAAIVGLDRTFSEFIKNSINKNLYNDNTVNKLIALIYSTIVNAIEPLDINLANVMQLTGDILITELKKLDIALYPEDLALYIDGDKYSEVKKALISAGKDWSNYDSSTTWHVTDKESFIDAAGQVFSGLYPLLKAAFGNTDLQGKLLDMAVITVSHMDLYDRVILPLFEGLETETSVSSEAFNKIVSCNDMTDAILRPVIGFVENFACAPISTIINILPKLAYVLDLNIIPTLMQSVKINLTAQVVFIKIDILAQMGIKDNSVWEIIKHFAPDFDLTFLSDINGLVKIILNKAVPDSNIVLPTINQSVLASHGAMFNNVESLTSTGKRNQLITNAGDTLLACLRYILPMLADSDFLNAVKTLTGGKDANIDATLKDILDNLGFNTDNSICAVVELCVPQEYKPAEYEFISQDTPGELINEVEYTVDWTQSKADYIDRNIADYADNVIKLLGGKNSPSLSHIIKSFINNEVYTGKTVTSLVLLIKDEIKKLNTDLTPLFMAFDIDTSLWNEVEEGYDWGFENGDREGFKNALLKAVSPLNAYFGTIFADSNANVMSGIVLEGYNGYLNGIVPVLEAVGCDSDSITDGQEYKTAVGENANRAAELFLEPLFMLLEKIYDEPVDQILDMLPNVIYFITSGGLNTAAKNTLQAVLAVFDTIRPVIDIKIDLNFDIASILIDLVSKIEVDGKPLGLKIPFLNDPASLVVGRITPYESKSGMTLCKIQNSVEADFMTVLLRNIVEIVFYKDNMDLVADYIAAKMNFSNKQTSDLKKVFYLQADLYRQVNGVDKTINSIYIIFKGSGESLDMQINSMSNFNDRWNAVFKKLYESGDPVLVELAENAEKTLSFISLGIVDKSGIGTDGLIDVFNRIIAFFNKVIDFFKNLFVS